MEEMDTQESGVADIVKSSLEGNQTRKLPRKAQEYVIARLIEGDTYDEIRFALIRQGYAKIGRPAIWYYAQIPEVKAAIEQRRKTLIEGSLVIGELRIRRLVKHLESIWQMMYFPPEPQDGVKVEVDFTSLSEQFIKGCRELSRLVDPIPGSLNGQMAGGNVYNILQINTPQASGQAGMFGVTPEVLESEKVLLRTLDKYSPAAAEAYRKRLASARDQRGLPAPDGMSDISDMVEAEFIAESEDGEA